MNSTARPLLSAAALMDDLERAGVRFALNPAGEPVFRASRGALTDEQRAALVTHREAIGELLAAVGPECWQPTGEQEARSIA